MIGPCHTSVFARNCTNCRLFIVCQQFRSRDLKDCDVLLYSSTEPVIETSKGTRMGCWNAAYEALVRQMDAAKLSPWNNRWSEVHNFTPEDGGWERIPFDEAKSMWPEEDELPFLSLPSRPSSPTDNIGRELAADETAEDAASGTAAELGGGGEGGGGVELGSVQLDLDMDMDMDVGMDVGSEVTGEVADEVTSPDLEVSFEAETVAEIAAAAKVGGWGVTRRRGCA